MATKTNQIIFELKAIDNASSVMQKVGSELNRFAKYGGAGAQPFDLKPLRPRLEFDDAEIRKGVADAVKTARDEFRAKERAIKVGGFDPNKESRARFLESGVVADALKTQNTESGGFLEKTLQISKAMKVVGKAAVGVTAAIEMTNVATGIWHAGMSLVAQDHDEAVKHATAARDAIASIPFFGEKILKLGGLINKLTIDKLTGESAYVEQLTKATAEQEKQIAIMEKRAKQRDQDNKKAEGIAGRVGIDPGSAASEEQQFLARRAKERRELAESLAPLKDKGGKLTETGKSIARDAEKRFAAEDEARARDEAERKGRALKELEAEQLRTIGKVAEAERVEFLETERQKRVAASERSLQAGYDEQAISAERIKVFEQEQRKKADALAKEQQEEKDKVARSREIEKTESERDAAKVEVDRLKDEDKKITPVQLAGANQSRFLTGLIEASKANNPIPVFVKAAQDQLRAAKGQIDKLDEILRQLRKGGGNVIIPVSNTN